MELLTPTDVAKRGCVSRSLIYGLIRQGKLPAYRVGVNGKGKLLIKWADWETFLEECRVSPWPRRDEHDLKYLK